MILLALTLSAAHQKITLMPLPKVKGRFVVVSHRGNHVDVPENTLDAIKEAIRVGADYAEIDIRTTKDGKMVIMHDGTVNRTTDGKGRVEDLTFAEIRALNIKDAKHPAIKRQVPTFEEVLEAAKGRIHLYMDIKAVTPKQVLPVLQKYKMERSVIAYLYSGEQIDQWRAVAPKIPIISDVEMKSPEELEKEWRAHPFEILDGPAPRYRLDLVVKAHELGIKVWPDIENPNEEPSQWEQFLKLGIDGFQTDHPDMMVTYLRLHDRR